MAVTQDTYTGDGSRLQFPFTFPYLQKSDVKVKLDGTTQATTEYFWHNATTIQMNTAPASGVVVIIYRDTNNDAKKGTFYAGSMIKAEDLNDNFDQILYVAQEVSNNAMSTLGTAQMQGNMEFGKGMGIVFEGSTADAFETTLNVIDPTADRAVNLPNVDGTLISTGDTGTVTGTMIANATITGLDIANDTIDSQHYVAGSVDLEHMSANSVDSDQYVDGSIDRVHLAADIVDGTKIDDHAINSEHIAAGSVDLAHMSANSVDSDQYVDGSIDLVHMSANSVDSDQYVDGSIDLVHMSANSVDSDQYVDGSIDRVHLSADIIDATKIEDNAVETSHLENARLTTLSGMNGTTASKLSAGTALTSTIDNLNQISGLTKQTGSNLSNTDDSFPTSKAVVEYVAAQIAPLGGLEVIADEDNFPSIPNAGVVISISNVDGIVVDSSGVCTTARTAGNGSDNVTINGFPTALRSKTLTGSLGLMVSSTGSSNTYNYHKLLGKEDDIEQLSQDINDFGNRYRVAGSAPSDDKDEGDLWYDTGNNRMMVYNGTAWEEVTSTGSFTINTLGSSSGTPGTGGSASFNGSANQFQLNDEDGNVKAPNHARNLIVSINGVVQKPNSGTSVPSEGFAIKGNDIIFSTAPASGSDWFIVTIGSSVDLGAPSDDTVSTAKIQVGAVITDRLATDAVDGTKIANDSIGYEHIEDLDGDVKWLDNKKIILGTGSDIQLYHDHTNSLNLLRAYNHPFKIQTNNDEDAIVITQNGSVALHEDSDKRFETTGTGVEITGTTATQKLTATNTYSATGTTQVGYQVHNESDTTDTYAALRLTAGTSSPATAQISSVRKGAGSNDITFQLEASNTAKEVMRLTSAGKVGIGINDPTAKLAIPGGTASIPRLAFESTAGIDNDFTFSQYEDGNGVYTLVGQNVKLDSSGNNSILDSGHKTAGITFDGRNNGALMFNTGDTNAFTEAMRIDKSGRILIGSGAATTTDSNRLVQLVGDTNGGAIITLARDDSDLSNETIGGFEFFGNDTTGSVWKKCASISVEAAADWNGSDYPSQMVFKTTVDGTNTPARKLELGHNYVQTNCSFNANSSDNSEALATFVEGAGCKLYHDGSQRLETTGNGATIHSGTTSSPGCLKVDCGVGAADQVYISFEYGGDNSGGGIRRDNTTQTPQFYTGSDRRIKKDIVDLAGTLSKLNQIQLKSFKYKNDPDAAGIGPIAQDLISIFPNKVKKSDGDDGTGDTVPDGVEPWTVGTGFTWEIIKAIQELSAKVAALEAA